MNKRRRVAARKTRDETEKENAKARQGKKTRQDKKITTKQHNITQEQEQEQEQEQAPGQGQGKGRDGVFSTPQQRADGETCI